MDTRGEVEGAKPRQEEEEREDNVQCGDGSVKTEEAEDGEQRPDADAEGEAAPEEDGMERGVDDQRTEDEEDEEEGETLNEPQDLSLMDYSRYDGEDPSNSHAAAAAAASGEADHAPGLESGELDCDTCGLSCVSVNVLLVHKRSHTGERPFHCTQCGASFTQKGNLLRHIKLHSGEKPFKCPMCSYACRRRDALSGHLRTHSVEKPFKCSHCSRSYKQRGSLEEHRDRCHVFVRSREEGQSSGAPPPGAGRALLLDRLAGSVARRKRSMPQKFTGDSGVCLDLSFTREMAEHRADTRVPLLVARRRGPDGDRAPSRGHYPFRSTAVGLVNGHKTGVPPVGLPPTAARPPRTVELLRADGSHVPQSVTYSFGHLLGGLSHQNGAPRPHTHTQPVPLSPARADGDGGATPGAVYPCGYCRVIFLDYVMFTIHMGCHGFRDPLECNVCGHRSRDRYEFSSHIARGEHRLEVK